MVTLHHVHGYLGYNLQVPLVIVDLCALPLARVRGRFGVEFKGRKKLPLLYQSLRTLPSFLDHLCTFPLLLLQKG